MKRKSIKSIFSTVATSAVSYEITVRAQAVTAQNAVLWDGKRLCITAVDKARHFYTLTALLLRPAAVTRKVERYGKNELNNPVRLEPEIQSFPAWLSEKYVRYARETPAAATETKYILHVPNAVDLIPVGDIIVVDGVVFAVEAQHLLDPERREYEIVARGDA